jgi:hypothetical protein
MAHNVKFDSLFWPPSFPLAILMRCSLIEASLRDAVAAMIGHLRIALHFESVECRRGNSFRVALDRSQEGRATQIEDAIALLAR